MRRKPHGKGTCIGDARGNFFETVHKPALKKKFCAEKINQLPRYVIKQIFLFELWSK